MTGFLPKAGGYRGLKAFQLAEAICDLTVIFIDRFVPRTSRTRDQMEQAARSGKQNIAEGSSASATSKETEIKLTNVAKASLEELLLDYEDYLRQHSLEIWHKNSPRILRLREYLKSEEFMTNPTRFASKFNATEFCNLMISLIHQTSYLLSRLLIRQQQQFLQQGGIREQMFRARTTFRNQPKKSDPSDNSDPSGPSEKSANPDTSEKSEKSETPNPTKK